MEYASGGELFDEIARRRPSLSNIQQWFSEIVSVLETLHLDNFMRIAHRDLKLENILLDAQGRVKVADFGFSIPYACPPSLNHPSAFPSSSYNPLLHTFCGSLHYTAPEMLSDTPNKQISYSPPLVEVWAAGVVLFALAYGRLPFDDTNPARTFALIRKGLGNDLSTPCLGHEDLNDVFIAVDTLTPIGYRIPREVITSQGVVFDENEDGEALFASNYGVNFDTKDRECFAGSTSTTKTNITAIFSVNDNFLCRSSNHSCHHPENHADDANGEVCQTHAASPPTSSMSPPLSSSLPPYLFSIGSAVSIQSENEGDNILDFPEGTIPKETCKKNMKYCPPAINRKVSALTKMDPQYLNKNRSEDNNHPPVSQQLSTNSVYHLDSSTTLRTDGDLIVMQQKILVPVSEYASEKSELLVRSHSNSEDDSNNNNTTSDQDDNLSEVSSSVIEGNGLFDFHLSRSVPNIYKVCNLLTEFNRFPPSSPSASLTTAYSTSHLANKFFDSNPNILPISVCHQPNDQPLKPSSSADIPNYIHYPCPEYNLHLSQDTENISFVSSPSRQPSVQSFRDVSSPTSLYQRQHHARTASSIFDGKVVDLLPAKSFPSVSSEKLMLKDLIVRMLEVDPSKRIRVEQLREHPFLKNACRRLHLLSSACSAPNLRPHLISPQRSSNPVTFPLSPSCCPLPVPFVSVPTSQAENLNCECSPRRLAPRDAEEITRPLIAAREHLVTQHVEEIEEAARLCGCDPNSLREQVRAGRLNARTACFNLLAARTHRMMQNPSAYVALHMKLPSKKRLLNSRHFRVCSSSSLRQQQLNQSPCPSEDYPLNHQRNQSQSKKTKSNCSLNNNLKHVVDVFSDQPIVVDSINNALLNSIEFDSCAARKNGLCQKQPQIISNDSCDNSLYMQSIQHPVTPACDITTSIQSCLPSIQMCSNCMTIAGKPRVSPPSIISNLVSNVDSS